MGHDHSTSFEVKTYSNMTENMEIMENHQVATGTLEQMGGINVMVGGGCTLNQPRLEFVAMPKPDRTHVTEGQAQLIKQIHQFNPELLQATQNSLPEEEMKMRCAVTPHHRNTQYSHTSEYWRQTCSVDEYRILQEIRRNQMNIPTSSGDLKEEHLIIAHRIAEMEKRRVGTKFLDRDVTENDM